MSINASSNKFCSKTKQTNKNLRIFPPCFFLSIHSLLLIQFMVVGWAGGWGIPSQLPQDKSKTWKCRSNTERQITIHTHTGLWEILKENSHNHRENMQTPHMKVEGGDEPEPSCCTATVQLTKMFLHTCSFSFQFILINYNNLCFQSTIITLLQSKLHVLNSETCIILQ